MRFHLLEEKRAANGVTEAELVLNFKVRLAAIWQQKDRYLPGRQCIALGKAKDR
jgi:hypothetical protein